MKEVREDREDREDREVREDREDREDRGLMGQTEEIRMMSRPNRYRTGLLNSTAVH